MRKVLVAYDSPSGSTARTAELLAAKLKERGAAAEALPISDVRLPGTFDLLVLGSPLRFGRPGRRMRRFVQENREALSRCKTALFFNCLALWTIRGASRPPFPVFMDPGLLGEPKEDRFLNMVEYTQTLSFTAKRVAGMLGEISPSLAGFLRGALDLSRLGLADRLLMLALMIFVKETDEGDFTDPEAVDAFAETLLS